MGPTDEQILAAVAEGAAEMEALVADLVAPRPVFGNEAPVQDVMRRAFAGLGLEPVDVPFDPDALRASPAASPFSWDVTGKANVIARWPAAGDGGRSLILNGHADVVSAAPVQAAGVPFTVTVTAVDTNGVTVATNGVVTLSATGNAQFDGNGNLAFGEAGVFQRLGDQLGVIGRVGELAEIGPVVAIADHQGKAGFCRRRAGPGQQTHK